MDRALVWDRGTLKLLDQSVLPHQTRVVACATADEVADAIRTMKVRGAPAIGAAAAYGLVLAAQTAADADPPTLRAHLDAAARMLLGTRPTADNLRWAVERMLAVAGRGGSPPLRHPRHTDRGQRRGLADAPGPDRSGRRGRGPRGCQR